jgi:DnaJ-class molecular chaperone
MKQYKKIIMIKCDECNGIGSYQSRSIAYLMLTHDTVPFCCGKCHGVGMVEVKE